MIYDRYLGADLEPITFKCPGFSNPTTPTIIGGYTISIFNKNDHQTNEASSVSLDATSLQPSLFPGTNLAHSYSNRQIGEKGTINLEFKTDIPVSSTDGCFVKLTFPA